MADDSKAPKTKSAKYGAIEVRAPEDELDEVVLNHRGVHFHLEQMSDGHWWMCIRDADGHGVHINLWGTGEVVARAEYEGVCKMEQP